MTRKKKLSLGTVLVLHALARGIQYGFDLVEETGLSSGTVYPALERLERLGFARSKWENAKTARAEKRPARRYFHITPEGAKELQSAVERNRAFAPVELSPDLEGSSS